MDQTLSTVGPAGEADVHGARLQDERASRRSLDDRPLDQLCHRDADRLRQTGRALDLARRRSPLPARQLAAARRRERLCTGLDAFTLKRVRWDAKKQCRHTG